MRKIFITSFLILLSVVMVSGSAYALSGVCSNCHTMHYSQNGTTVGDGGGPYGYLLYATCVGCHTGSSGQKNTHDAPIVYHTTAPSGQGAGKTLAGGDFYWVATTGGATDNKGHNVVGIAGLDAAIGGGTADTPPGWDPNATPGALSDGQVNGGEAAWDNQLTCAGKFGCHGNHSDVDPEVAIKGSHHTNTGLTATKAENAATVAASYRFLGGINGLENSEWNWNESASIHNEYYGVNDTANRNQTYTQYNNKRTMSYLCAQCHGKFHSQIDDTTTGSAWLRHPTDILLPSTAGKEFSAYTNYSVEAPVARSAVPTGSNSTVTPGTDIVMCLSCHRAHGSPQPDLLRWPYSGMVVGTTGESANTGCFTCHTTKDGA